MNTRMDPRIFTTPLLNVATDMTDVVTKTKNAWMYNFLELFKKIIDTFPMPEECERYFASPEKKGEFFRKYVIPTITEVNVLIKKNNTHLVELGDIEMKVKSGLHNPETFDLMQDRQYERITNPSINDMIPDIYISERCFMEQGPETGFPHGKIPMMNIIPSVASVYEKNDNIGSLYYKTTKHAPNTESACLEISLNSIYPDWVKLSQEVRQTENGGRELTELGLCDLRDIVEKYTAFAVPLIMVNLRKDYEYGNNLIDEIYNYFSNNFQSAIVANKYMYGITNALIYSKIGKGLVTAWTFKYCTSTIDLINPNFKYLGLLKEQFDNFSTDCSISGYMQYVQNDGIDYGPHVAPAENERDAFARFITKIFNLILQVFATSMAVNGAIVTTTKINSILASAIGPLDAAIKGGNFEWSYINDCLRSVVDGIKAGGVRELVKIVAQVQMIKPSSNAEGALANKNQFTPIAQQVLSGKTLQIQNYIGNNSAALECANLMREIINTGHSNAAMRMIATECENLHTYEDARKVLIEAAMFQEVLAKTVVPTHESAPHAQFKVFLANTRKEVSNWMKELKPY